MNGKITSYAIGCLIISLLISWALTVLFVDSKAMSNPTMMLGYAANITHTYPIFLYPFAGSIVLFGILVTVHQLTKDDEYGEAHFASTVEISKMKDRGLFEPTGLILGQFGGRYVRTNDSLSVLIVAPQGTGKTAALIIPTLLSDTSSFIINDVKGELWDLTSLQRSYFGRVGIFAPSKNLTGALRWNPLDKKCLPSDFDDQIDFVDRIGAILYPTEETQGTERHFNAEARTIFTYFALKLIVLNGGTSLPEIYEHSLETDDIQGAIALDLEEYEDQYPSTLVTTGNRILQKAEEEFGGSATTFTQALEPFSRPNVARNLRDCDFTHRDFKSDKPFSLYIFIPANDISRIAPVVRILAEYLVKEFLSLTDKNEINKQRVVFCMDEFPRMGKMTSLFEAPALQRSYKMATMFVAQDKNQLEATYGKGSFEQACTITDYKAIFRQNEDSTAQKFSSLVGKTTRKKKNVSKKDLEFVESLSTSKEGVPLLLPQDFMNQNKNKVTILASGHHETPIMAKCAWWFKDRKMRKLSGAYNGLNVSEMGTSHEISDNLQPNAPQTVDEIPENNRIEAESGDLSEKVSEINVQQMDSVEVHEEQEGKEKPENETDNTGHSEELAF